MRVSIIVPTLNEESHIVGTIRHRAFVEATAGSQSLGAKVIVPVVDAEKSTSALSFAGLVRSCVCQLVLSGGAIAMANAIVGTVPCSKS
jgi:hypothetical protein